MTESPPGIVEASAAKATRLGLGCGGFLFLALAGVAFAIWLATDDFLGGGVPPLAMIGVCLALCGACCFVVAHKLRR